MPALVNQQSYDLVFSSDGLGLHLLRDRNGVRAVSEGFGPALQNEDPHAYQDVPVRWDDFSGGGGFSQPFRNVKGVYSYARNVCTRFGPALPRLARNSIAFNYTGPITSADLGNCTGMFEFGGHLYVLYGRFVARIDTGTSLAALTFATGGTDPVKDLGAGYVADGAAKFGNAVYIGASGGNFWRLTGTSTYSNASGQQMRKFATVYWVTSDGVGAMRLVGVPTNLTSFMSVAAGADPMTTGNWTAAVSIGNGEYLVQSLAASARHVWFCTQGGIFDVDERGYAPNVTPYWRQHYDPDHNGARSLYSGGYIYASVGHQLDRVDVTNAMRHDDQGFVLPDAYVTNETPVYGPVTAICREGPWIIINRFNGTDSYLCYGIDRRVVGIEGPGPMVWHLGEVYLANQQVDWLYVTAPTGVNPRLWLSSHSVTTGEQALSAMTLPIAGNPIQDLLTNRNTSGDYTGSLGWFTGTPIEMYLTAEDWGTQNARKVVLGWRGRIGRVSESTYIRVYARDQAVRDAAWVQQGTGADPKMQTEPRSQLAASSNVVKGHNIEVRVSFQGTGANPPLVYELQANAEMVVEQRNTRRYSVVLGSNQLNRNGGFDLADPAETWATLVSLMTKEPRWMVDELGVSRWVRVNPTIKRREAMHWPAGVDQGIPVWVADIEVSIVPSTEAELDLEGSAIASDPGVVEAAAMTWDSGDTWDSGKVWG